MLVPRPTLFINEGKITKINNSPGGLTQNKDRVFDKNRISEKHKASYKAEIPERYRDSTLFYTFQ